MKISGPTHILLPILQELAFTPFGLVQLYGRDTVDVDCRPEENLLGGLSEDGKTLSICHPFSEEDEDFLRAYLQDLKSITLEDDPPAPPILFPEPPPTPPELIFPPVDDSELESS